MEITSDEEIGGLHQRSIVGNVAGFPGHAHGSKRGLTEHLTSWQMRMFIAKACIENKR